MEAPRGALVWGKLDRASSGPSAGGLGLATVVAVALLPSLGCDSSTSASATTSASSAADPVAAASAMIVQDCHRCHAPASLHGKTRADIRKAIRDIPSMSQYEGKLSEAQLQALEQVLAAPAGK